MEADSEPAMTRMVMMLNRAKLDELRRASGIASDSELASIVGVDNATMWRALNGNPVSSSFIARMKIAFPNVATDLLFQPTSVEKSA